MTRPDLLLICTDQQHAGMMSCAGNPWLRTPAVDGLAARGTRFTRAYATNPICVPSRFSMMTGRMPSEIGLRGNQLYFDHTLPLGEITDEIKATALGHRLRAAGYETAYAGKQHLVRSQAEDYGFSVLTDDWYGGGAQAAADFLRRPHDRPIALQVHLMNPHDIALMAVRDSQETEEDRQWVAMDRPALANLDAAMAAPAGLDAETFFSEVCPPLPDNFAPQEPEPGAVKRRTSAPGSLRYIRERWDDRRWRLHRWAYARLTESVDAQVGLVLDALAESGRQERTLVVFASDHGDMDGAHRLVSKAFFYEESANVPFIMAGPGVPAGVVDDDHLVSLGLDLLPTFCDFAGAPVANDPRGRSLRRLIEAAAPNRRDDVPVESADGDCVVGTRWKYARFGACGDEEWLVDMHDDPGELRNRAADTDVPEVLAACRERWHAHFGGDTHRGGAGL